MNNYDWWWSIIDQDENWSSLPPSTKLVLLGKLQQCVAHFAKININKEDLQSIIDDVGDVTPVFDAILESWAWEDVWKDTHRKYIYNLKRAIVKKLGDSRVKKQIWHKERTRRVSSKPPVDMEFVEKYSPYNFRVCSKCGERIANKVTRGRRPKIIICDTCRKKDG